MFVAVGCYSGGGCCRGRPCGGCGHCRGHRNELKLEKKNPTIEGGGHHCSHCYCGWCYGGGGG